MLAIKLLPKEAHVTLKIARENAKKRAFIKAYRSEIIDMMHHIMDNGERRFRLIGSDVIGAFPRLLERHMYWILMN